MFKKATFKTVDKLIYLINRLKDKSHTMSFSKYLTPFILKIFSKIEIEANFLQRYL